MNSLEAEVEVWGLPELGLPLKEINYRSSALISSEYSFPRLNPLRSTTPDPNLIPFNRILSLLSGGIKAREGKLTVPGSPDEAVEALIKIFRNEGLLPGE